MPWYRKDRSTPFDKSTIDGVFTLDGDVIADTLGKDWTRNHKLPMIAFPSGVVCELWQGFPTEQQSLVHLFGEMDLPLFHTVYEAYKQALCLADQYGYKVRFGSSHSIEVWRHYPLTHLEVFYDEAARRMTDVQRIK